MFKFDRNPVIYPVVLLLYFFLNFYSSNSTSLLFPTESILRYLALSLITVLILWAGLTWFWKDAAKAGLYIAVLVLLFFSYGHVYEAIYFRGKPTEIYVHSDEILLRSHLAILFVWALLFAATTMLIIARGHLAYHLTSTLNFTVGVLFVLALIPLITNNTLSTIAGASDFQSPTPIPIESSAEGYGDELPDIYYIILDGYARADVLREVYDYENDFVDFLESKGFYVAPESNTNYTVTLSSLPSTINMRYLTSEDLDQVVTLQRLITDSVVCRTLREIGYNYIAMETIMTGVSHCADFRIANTVNNLDIIFLKTTLVRPLLNQAIWGKPTYQNHLDRVDALMDIASREEPTFTYAHFILPHNPFVFDREGNQVFGDVFFGGQAFRDAYLDQLIYTNVLFEEVVDRILEESDVPPIIIIHADHGPASVEFEDHLNTRLPILNAYYFPHGGGEDLYPSISPVNTFRVMLNYYFGADLELLDDKSFMYFSTSGQYEQVSRPADNPD